MGLIEFYRIRLLERGVIADVAGGIEGFIPTRLALSDRAAEGSDGLVG